MSTLVAVYQGDGHMRDVDGNLRVVHRITGEAGASGAELAIFPEMFATGYNIGEATLDLAEGREGRIVSSLRRSAREAGCAIICGYPERDGAAVYNSAAIVDASGKCVGNYRKCHLFGDMERSLFRSGEGRVIVDLAGLRVGILVCYDIEFPEPSRLLALEGVDLIAVPTSLMVPFDVVTQRLVPSRAFENSVFVAYANRAGREGNLAYVGQSCIAGPDGADLARGGHGEELLLAGLDRTAIGRARATVDYLKDRRPELYSGLGHRAG